PSPFHVLVSLTSIQHTPSSTLSPYTTLFRSFLTRTTTWISTPTPRSTSAEPGLRPMPASTCRASAGSKSLAGKTRYVEAGIGRKDRKSTRLNSSHQISSYAVFCLKKQIDRQL